MKQVFFFLLMACIVALQPVSAQTTKRLSDLEKKRKEALQTIEETSKQLDKNKTTAKNTVYKLNVLNDKIKKRESFLKVLNKEMKELDTEVGDNKTAYEELSRNLGVKKQQYARSLRIMSRKNKSEDKLMFLFVFQESGSNVQARPLPERILRFPKSAGPRNIAQTKLVGGETPPGIGTILPRERCSETKRGAANHPASK